MADTQQSQSQDGSLGRDLLYALRYYLGSRRGLLVLAGLAIAMGLALNWSWLAAAGIDHYSGDGERFGNGGVTLCGGNHGREAEKEQELFHDGGFWEYDAGGKGIT